MPAVVYMLGILLVIAGAAYAAFLVGIPATWILIGAVVLAGLGIMASAAYLRRRTVVTTAPAQVPLPPIIRSDVAYPRI